MDVYGIETLLGLPEFHVINQVIRPKWLDVHLERRAANLVCPQCQACCSRLQDRRPRCIRDLPILERPVVLWLHLRRFECSACSARPWEKSETFGEHVKWTQRLYNQVRQEYLCGCPCDELARRWGISARPVVAGGAGDNAASACGMGTVAPGRAFVSLGTSGVLFAANASYLPNAESAVHTFCHALPNTWHQMGVILSATDCINWLEGVTGAPASELTGKLGDELRAPSGVTFLPYLSGERTPHNDATIRGAFIGLAHQSDRSVLTQAVLEGVAFALRDNLEALKAAGTELSRVTATGGGSRSAYWLKAIATALAIPVDLPAEGEFGAAFGAARLGLIAAEGADPLAICTQPATAHTIEPDMKLADAYAEAYGRYRALYPAIRGVTS
jgi:sugar (pentulose or hexulose) kinase